MRSWFKVGERPPVKDANGGWGDCREPHPYLPEVTARKRRRMR